jgi:hypothetical protein
VEPNPVGSGNSVTIRSSSALSKAEVYDLIGKLVFKANGEIYQTAQNSIVWNTKDAPAGVYVVKAMVNNQTAVKRIVLAK